MTGRVAYIAGMPSDIGGATTELDHFIDLLLRRDVEVHVVPTTPAQPFAMEALRRRGCRVHLYAPGVFANQVVIAFCNPAFLRKLPEIADAGRPRRVVWFNCNNWTLAGELEAHAHALIDVHGFVSDYQRRLLLPKLAAVRPVQSFDYKPFLNLDRITFTPRGSDGTFRAGRVSRGDPAKFPVDTWDTFRRIRVPPGVRKRILVLGYDREVRRKIGAPPPDLDVTALPAGSVPARRVYAGLHALVYKTGGWAESYCRVLVEAYAHGVVPVVTDEFAFPELVQPQRTGFLARTSAELSEYATWLAHHPQRRLKMAQRGRLHVERLVDESGCWRAWPALLD